MKAAIAGVVLAVVPVSEVVSAVIVVAAALLAGWLLPEAPVQAAFLMLLPALAVGAGLALRRRELRTSRPG